MKIKYLDFRNGEYKLYEEYLNDLSSKGYELSSYDYYGSLVKNNDNYHYKVILFQKELNGVPKRKQIDSLINKYTNSNYQYCGKYKKMFIFRTKGTVKDDNEKSNLLINSDKINRIIFLALAIILFIFFTNRVINNSDISNYLTNGLIIFHYIPILITLIILFRMAYKGFFTFLKKSLKINLLFNKIFTFSYIICAVIAGGSLILDNFERTSGSINNYPDSEISFKTFNKEPTSTNLTYKKSMIISQSTSLIQQDKKDSLSLQKYIFKDQNTCNSFFKKEINYNKKYSDKNSAISRYTSDIYLIKSDNKTYGLILKNNKSFITLDTTFDISKDLNKLIKGNLK